METKDVDTKELEALNLLYYNPFDENGGVLSVYFQGPSLIDALWRTMVLDAEL